MKLYNGKWDNIWDKPKYQKIRDKILSSFDGLEFDEGPHKYYLNCADGSKVEMPCVSNITHLFQEHFDTDEIAQRTYERNFDNPESKYFQMTVDQIKQAWLDISKKACDDGTERHEFGESCFYFMTGQYDKILPAFKDRLHEDENGKKYFEAIEEKEVAAAKFYDDCPTCFVPILAETRVYIREKEYYYSGTFDLLMYYDQGLDERNINPLTDNSGLVVLDWKTNKDLYKNYNNKKLLYEFSEMLDMPLNLYKAQLSAYQNCLEKIGEKVVARRILWLLPDGTYDKINIENLVNLLRTGLRNHFDIKKLL